MGVLATYTPEYEEVQIKGAVLRVRGINSDDLGLLVRAHFETVQQILDAVREAQVGPAAGDVAARFILSLAQDAPRLAAQIIALASDEPDQADQAAKLPFAVTIDALTKIGRLTFEEAGGVQGFVNALMALVGGMRKPVSATPTSGA